MIKSYLRGDNPSVSHSKGVSFLDKKIEFNTGLNIVVGPNGSGKTALLESIRTYFLINELGGISLNPNEDLSEYLRENRTGRIGDTKYPTDRIQHDGSITLYDPSSATVMEMGTKRDLALVLAGSKSSGECRLGRLLIGLSEFKGTESPVNDLSVLDNKRYNSIYEGWVKEYKERYNADLIKTDKPRPTLVFDEPTNSMDYANTKIFWSRVLEWVKDFQIIIATHDMYLLSSLVVEHANINWIETVSGYLEGRR